MKSNRLSAIMPTPDADSACSGTSARKTCITGISLGHDAGEVFDTTVTSSDTLGERGVA
jgi:hypothetical protein